MPTSAPGDSSPAAYAGAISTVAVSQICQSIGYTSAQPSVLRSLSDLAGRYLETLASLAASHANSHGRTDSNLLDVAFALEHVSLPRGFPGAAKTDVRLLKSSVLRDLIGFVDAVEEIPFAKRIERRRGVGVRRGWKSFAEVGKQPPGHVPRWLPELPECLGGVEEERMDGGGVELEMEKREECCDLERKVLPGKRPQVRFKLEAKGGEKFPLVLKRKAVFAGRKVGDGEVAGAGLRGNYNTAKLDDACSWFGMA